MSPAMKRFLTPLLKSFLFFLGKTGLAVELMKPGLPLTLHMQGSRSIYPI
jgi:hypothetical protein